MDIKQKGLSQAIRHIGWRWSAFP